MINEEYRFKDAIKMHDFIIQYLKDYNPAGYSTDINITIEFNYEKFMKTKEVTYYVHIERLESCD